uniref:Armadillo repeat-containing protein 7 n=1 Tax=Fundulus heteroclitus TaxID=8078 RepID=A0A146PZ53_FUNHE
MPPHPRDTPRPAYLSQLVAEYSSSKTPAAHRRQILANLANFAYDAINHPLLAQLGAGSIFAAALSGSDDELVVIALDGLINLHDHPVPVEDIAGCLRRRDPDVVVRALALLYQHVEWGVISGRSHMRSRVLLSQVPAGGR